MLLAQRTAPFQRSGGNKKAHQNKKRWRQHRAGESAPTMFSMLAASPGNICEPLDLLAQYTNTAFSTRPMRTKGQQPSGRCQRERRHHARAEHSPSRYN